jgi:hypothetical protein
VIVVEGRGGSSGQGESSLKSRLTSRRLDSSYRWITIFSFIELDKYTNHGRVLLNQVALLLGNTAANHSKRTQRSAATMHGVIVQSQATADRGVHLRTYRVVDQGFEVDRVNPSVASGVLSSGVCTRM